MVRSHEWFSAATAADNEVYEDSSGERVLLFSQDFTSLDDRVKVDKLLRRAFRQIDVDGNGIVDPHELTKALQLEGLYPLDIDRVVEDYKRRFEKSGRRGMTFPEFRTFMLQFQCACREDAFKTSGIDIFLGSLTHEATHQIAVGYDDAPHGRRMAEPPHDQELSPIHLLLQMDVLISFLAGAIAGKVSRTSCSPLERMKLLYQTGRIASTTPLWNAFQQVYHQHANASIRWFYQGNFANIIRIAPTSALQYATYPLYKRMIFPSTCDHELQPYQRLVCGALAGMTARGVCYPLDFMRTRIAVGNSDQRFSIPGNPGYWNTVKYVYRNETGFRGFYRGLAASLTGVMPYIAVHFATFETLKYELMEIQQRNELPVIQTLMCGSVSGFVGQTVAFPMDVIRRQVQIAHKDMSIREAIAKLKAEEGGHVMRGLFRGFVPNAFKVVPSVSISFLAYETAKDGLLALLS